MPPQKTISINNKNLIRQPWISRGIINSVKTRDKLFKKCMGKPRDSTEYQKYLTYRNILNSTKRKSKQTYYGKLLTEYRKDIRKTWQVLNTKINRTNDKSNIADNFIIENTATNDPQIIADGFCKYFTNIGTQLAGDFPNVGIHPNTYLNQQKSVHNSIYLNPTSPDEISKIITSLKQSKSCGKDNISNTFLNEK